MREILLAFATASFLATLFVSVLGYRARTPGRLPREAALPASGLRRPRRITAA